MNIYLKWVEPEKIQAPVVQIVIDKMPKESIKSLLWSLVGKMFYANKGWKWVEKSALTKSLSIELSQ